MLARIEGMSTALDYQKEWRDVTELRRSKAAVVEEVRSQNEHQPHAKDLLLFGQGLTIPSITASPASE